MTEQTPYSVDGKPVGRFYRYENGKCLLLIWAFGAKTKALHFKKNAWLMNTDALYAAESNGATAIGIAHRIGKEVTLYITNLADYWNPPSESFLGGKRPQRLLPRDKFKINTGLKEESIESAMRLH